MLLRILSGEMEGNVIALGDTPVTIGRTGQNDVVLPDPAVSRQHVQIYSHDGNWFLRNLQPEKAIYLNNSPVSSIVQLRPNTVFQIGSTQLQLEPDPEGTAVMGEGASSSGSHATLLPVLMGVGGGILILALVFLLANRGGGGEIALVDAAATETASAQAVALATSTATNTPTARPSTTATVTASRTRTPTATRTETATATPSPTPTPLLMVQVGDITTDVYTPNSLDPALLETVPWNHDILATVPITFTNNSEAPINRSEVVVGLFAVIGGERRQVPSFLLPVSAEENEVIEPGETQTMRWQVVLPNETSIEAWAIQYGEFRDQGFLTEE